MGLFDKIFNSNSNQHYTPQNEQEAWVALMYACISVDGDVSNAEVDKLCQLLVYKTIFNGHDLVNYYKTAMATHKQIGSKALIDQSVSKISEDNKPTLFALIMELLLADGMLGNQEKEIAEYLTTSLNFNSSTAEKIVEVMLIRNQGNVLVLD